MDTGTAKALNEIAQGVLSNALAIRALDELLVELELLKKGEVQQRVYQLQANLNRTLKVVDETVKKEGNVIMMPGASE